MILEMPSVVIVAGFKRAHCGALPYFLGVPVGLALGAAIAWLTWKSGRFLWLKFNGRSKSADNLLGIGLLILHICSLMVAFASGVFVQSVLTKFVH
jgi:hypothetical protein